MAIQIAEYTVPNRATSFADAYVSFLGFKELDIGSIEAYGKQMTGVFGVFESEAFYNTLKFNMILQPDQVDILAVDPALKKITISADNASAYDIRTKAIVIGGSTANDGTYTIVSTSVEGDNLHIVVSEAIADNTVDGKVDRLRSYPLIMEESRRLGVFELSMTYEKYLEFVDNDDIAETNPKWAGKNLRDIFKTQVYEWAKSVHPLLGSLDSVDLD